MGPHWTSFGSRTTGNGFVSVRRTLSEGALLPSERGRSSLRVAERERRDPGQVDCLPRRARNDRDQPRRVRPCECTRQPLDDAEQQTRDEQREQAERQLEQ